MKHSVADISRKLSDQCEAVCRKLLPTGKQVNGEWVCGSTAGNEGDSLKIHLTGSNSGHWRDWANQDEHGDLLDLWRFTKQITAQQAIQEAKEYLGLKDSTYESAPKTFKTPKKVTTGRIDAAGRAFKYLSETRKLDAAVINRFQIEGDKERQALVFPSYSPSGALINRSYRTLDEQKKVWQEEGCAPSLFGWQALSENAYREKTVLLAEGQIDAMSWATWGIDALSIPNGSGQSWIEYEWDNLEPFDKIYLAFDSDAAGQEMTRKTVARLGKHRCMIVKMPLKDANECLVAGHTAEEAKSWIEQSEIPTVDNLLLASDLRNRLFEEARIKPACPTLPCLGFRWPNAGYFPRPGELTLWSGEMNQGKSSILRALTFNLILKGVKVFTASMEEKPEKIIKGIVCISKKGTYDDVDIEVVLKEFGADMIFADCLGSISQETLLEMMNFSFHRYGASHFVIDSLMRIEDLEENYPAQGNFLNQLQKFCKDTDTHVHLVAHNRKASHADKGNRGSKVKGSSLLVNNADNIVEVSRNPDKEELREDGGLTPEKDLAMHDTEVRVIKQRETGWQGRILLKYDQHSRCFSSFLK